jgi:hypothetical protein
VRLGEVRADSCEMRNLEKLREFRTGKCESTIFTLFHKKIGDDAQVGGGWRAIMNFPRRLAEPLWFAETPDSLTTKTRPSESWRRGRAPPSAAGQDSHTLLQTAHAGTHAAAREGGSLYTCSRSVRGDALGAVWTEREQSRAGRRSVAHAAGVHAGE